MARGTAASSAWRNTFGPRLGLAASAQHPVELFATVWRRLPLRTRRKVDLIAKLGGNGANLAVVPDDLGRNGDQQLGPVNLVVLVLEQVAEDRNIADQGGLNARIGGFVLDQAAEHDAVAVVDGDRGLDASLLNGRGLDSRGRGQH